jgi:Flp pilus assembly protein TadG
VIGLFNMTTTFRKGLSVDRKSRGQSTVEFAFLIPALLVLVLVLLDGGRAYFTNQVILNAAREGARAGVLPEGTSADVTAAINTVMSSATLSGHMINFSNVGSGIAAGATTTVTVAYPFQTLTGSFIPGWEGTIDLEETVQRRHE